VTQYCQGSSRKFAGLSFDADGFSKKIATILIYVTVILFAVLAAWLKRYAWFERVSFKFEGMIAVMKDAHKGAVSISEKLTPWVEYLLARKWPVTSA
jgi:hypothetical protein